MQWDTTPGQFVELQTFNALNEILLEYGKKFMISGMVMKFKKFRIFIGILSNLVFVYFFIIHWSI